MIIASLVALPLALAVVNRRRPAQMARAQETPTVTLPILGDLPALTGGTWWINNPGIIRAELIGHVTMIASWTYGCYHCLNALRRMRMTTQRVPHYCMECWTAIADLAHVSMRVLIETVQPNADAKFVDFSSFDDGCHERWDIESTLHPQTMLVLAKDGAPLSPAWGEPTRVHGPIELGYTNTRYLTRIAILPAANGGYWSDRGYEWYGGT